MFRRPLVRALCLALIATPGAFAHTVWLEREPNDPAAYSVKFGGHGGKEEPLVPAKLKSIEAFDARGRAIALEPVVSAASVVVRPPATASVIAVHLDNGIYSRRAEGPSVEAPMNEVPGAVRATRALKYHKTVVRWDASVTQPRGQPFEVLPLDRRAPAAGTSVRVRVLLEGQPRAGVKLGFGEEPKEGAPVTDANGEARVVVSAGFNKLWAGVRLPVEGNPAFTELSYEYILGFDAAR
jgi:nickel transport protein